MSDMHLGVALRSRRYMGAAGLALGLCVAAAPASAAPRRPPPKSCQGAPKGQPLAHAFVCRLLASTKQEQIMPVVAAVAGELAQRVEQKDWMALLTEAAGGAQGLEQEVAQLWQNLLAQHNQEDEQDDSGAQAQSAAAGLAPELLAHVGQWATRMAMGLIESGASEQALGAWVEHIVGLTSPAADQPPAPKATKRRKK